MIGFILLALPIVVLSVAISYFALFLWGLKKNGQLNIFHRKEKKPNTILEYDRRQSFENDRMILNIRCSNLDYLKLQDELKDIDVEIEKRSKEIRIVDNREIVSNTFDLVKKEILQTNNWKEQGFYNGFKRECDIYGGAICKFWNLTVK